MQPMAPAGTRTMTMTTSNDLPFCALHGAGAVLLALEGQIEDCSVIPGLATCCEAWHSESSIDIRERHTGVPGLWLAAENPPQTTAL